MKTKLHVLMVDDHPMIVEGYKNTLLDNYSESYEVSIEVASNCDEAQSLIEKNASIDPYHLAMIDVKIPPSTDGLLTSGVDISKLVQEFHPEAKIMILTMHNENARIHNIIQNVNPNGMLIKSDLSSSELIRAVGDVMDGRTYYSDTVNTHFRKMFANDFTLDQKNVQILFHLSRGVQTKNLTNYVGLSLSAIEKRKNNIKELFGIKSGNDEQLIEEARSRGFV